MRRSLRLLQIIAVAAWPAFAALALWHWWCDAWDEAVRWGIPQ